jgi:hypothetical protein
MPFLAHINNEYDLSVISMLLNNKIDVSIEIIITPDITRGDKALRKVITKITRAPRAKPVYCQIRYVFQILPFKCFFGAHQMIQIPINKLLG